MKLSELKDLITKMEPVIHEIETPTLRNIRQVERYTIVENDEPGEGIEIKRIVFIDGKRRSFLSAMFGPFTGVFSEIAVGGVMWEKERGVYPLFSPENPPKVLKILGFPEDFRNFYGKVMDRVYVKNYVFEIFMRGKDCHDSVDSVLREYEKGAVIEALDEYNRALVVKDGTLPDIEDMYFKPGRGPVGLVKNIMATGFSHATFKNYYSMRKSERSRMFIWRVHSNLRALKVGTYLKLVDSKGLKGLVRMEALVKEEDLEALKEDIGKTFDSLRTILPTLTADLPIPRLPENILPIQFLEDSLSKYMTDRDYMITCIYESLHD